jgi:hypothetical protein
VLVTLGLERRTKDVTPPLDQYIRQRQRVRDADEVEDAELAE